MYDKNKITVINITERKAIALDGKFTEMFDGAQINPRELLNHYNKGYSILKDDINASVSLAVSGAANGHIN